MSGERETTRFVTTVGGVIAAIVSWSVNKSILWATIHCLLGWFYVIYHLITRP